MQCSTRGECMNIFRIAAALTFSILASAPARASDDPQKIAALFGARPDIETLALSPDGSKVVYLKPDAEGAGFRNLCPRRRRWR